MQLEIIVAVIVVVVLIGLLFLLFRRKRDSGALRERFGPEYDRTVSAHDDRRAAERELHEREERRQRLDIRPLTPAARERYENAWRDAQRQFVDAPDVALREADRLVTDVMRDRGYPMEEFDQRAADISVDHPEVVEDYRAAHQIAQDNEAGRADTEAQRRAMVHYRGLFERLLDASADEQRGSASAGTS